MNPDQWASVDQYLGSLLLPKDAVLDTALQASSDAGLPAIAVSPLQGKLLQMLAQMQNASRILEIGTLGGYSTLWLARGLAPGGRLVTLELDPKHARVARQNLDSAGLQKVVEIRIGPAIEALPKLVNEKAGPFDLIFIDADKANIPNYFAWSLKLSRPGTAIIVDNVIRKGEVANASSEDVSVRGVRRFLDELSRNKNVSATTLQTVGAKGYDGFTLAIVKNT
jgi:predicted O-methyltransferase YrrM